MKLYYDCGTWTIPGKQGRQADRVDVPNAPGELARWLNERDVSLLPLTTMAQAFSHAAEQLASDGERPWIAGPPTKDPQRVKAEDFKLVDGKTEFVPITRAAALDLSFQQCPACHRGAAAAIGADQVTAWVRSFASLDELQLVAEAIRAQVRELGEQIEDRSVQ
jgi:hypothetical protein